MGWNIWIRNGGYGIFFKMGEGGGGGGARFRNGELVLYHLLTLSMMSRLLKSCKHRFFQGIFNTGLYPSTFANLRFS